MRIDDIRLVGVVGFGLMGAQIAQVFAQSGFLVRVFDANPASMESGFKLIKQGRFGLEAAVKKARIKPHEAEEDLGRITASPSIAELCRGAQFVVEAVFEDMGLKKQVFSELDRHSPADVVLASNTSTMSISELATQAKINPARVVGMHFFNPVVAMKLVEIVRGTLSDERCVALATDLAVKLGKTPIVVKDSPGFATSRLGLALFLEAGRMVEEGVASVADIDLGMKLGYGHPMGPFELADLVGLDSRLRNIEAMEKASGEARWSSPRLLRQLVEAGYLGDPTIKPGSKGGYYEYFRLKRTKPA